MNDYISREAAIARATKGLADDFDAYNVKKSLQAIPAADVVSRKAYLDAIGTINQAHFYPERSAEIIAEFLKRYHALCMAYGERKDGGQDDGD